MNSDTVWGAAYVTTTISVSPIAPAAVAALSFALGDWWAVATGRKPAEYVFKPGVICALVAVVVMMEPPGTLDRRWFIAALVLSLAGDIFLMVPRDLFIPGLVSFLAAHIAYVVAFITSGQRLELVITGLILVAVAGAVVGRAILASLAAGSRSSLLAPVAAYMIVISAMVVSAIGSGRPLLAIAAVLFYASDALIAWTRFIRPLPWGPLAIIVTYHLAQGGFVLALGVD